MYILLKIYNSMYAYLVNNYYLQKIFPFLKKDFCFVLLKYRYFFNENKNKNSS